MIDMPPGKYFVSHSYWDRMILDGYTRPEKSTEVFAPDGKPVKLKDAIDYAKDPISLFKKQLPNDVELYIFDPIEELHRSQFVSNDLIAEMLKCDGLIYIADGASSRSFWVAFERDYALRSQKQVYAFHSANQTVALFNGAPLNLAIYPSIAYPVQQAARSLINYMADERYFKFWLDDYGLVGSTQGFIKWLESGMSEHIDIGGYVIAFHDEDKVPSHAYARTEMKAAFEQNRLIIVNLGMSKVQNFPENIILNVVDENGINNNRIDDLIVRLYWLIFRNQFPELVYD